VEGDKISRKAMHGWVKRDTYKSAVSEQLDIVLLADICHAVERPGVNQRELYNQCRTSIRVFFFSSSGRRTCGNRRGAGNFEIAMNTYLDLIGNDGTRAKLCADLVCPDRIKVYETEGPDVTVVLHVLKIAQGGHITLVGIVLPIKLLGGI
jgi:hypothetical protein